MRLINAQVSGFGRLVDATVNLDSKVIAIVGPNEAGKTTFLKALAYLSSDGELSKLERSRAAKIMDDSIVIRTKFAVELEDQEALVHLHLRQEPLTATISRKASGGIVQMRVEPQPRKETDTLSRIVDRLDFRLTHQANSFRLLLREDSAFSSDASDALPQFQAELVRLVKLARQYILDESQIEERDQELIKLSAELRGSLVDEDDEPDESSGDSLQMDLEMVRDWAGEEDPSGAVRTILWSRTPKFLLFDEEDRTLLSAYILNDELVQNPPNALSNLARMANLDVQFLLALLKDGDLSRRESELKRINARLADLFANAWKQSRIRVTLAVDGEWLRVFISENGNTVTVLGERSAGLRMFVALIAFLAARDAKIPPILLIDEAENHLHIDAQADLVNMFMSQEKAARVIYTTHSPACLPPDLGVGVRSISPLVSDEQVSEIRNSFWTNGAGFSPLMVAMGAAAAAFTLGRCVVLGEGATEMILLPSLLRGATGLSTLQFQVAPGLSEVPRDFYPSLDFQGAKVAYLLDGDAAGALIRNALIEKRVPESRIVVLPAPGLENTLPKATYVETVFALLGEVHPGLEGLERPELTEAHESSWSKQLEDWCHKNGMTMPSKVAVACRIIEEGRAYPSKEFEMQMAEMHQKLLVALEIFELDPISFA